MTPPTTEDWAQHPGLNLAMDGLAIYANWVSRVVMPIVFEWVAEHKQEMREKMGVKEKALLPDDVGAVVQAAFEIISENKAYMEGRNAFKEFQDEIKAGTWNPAGINETWTTMSSHLRIEVQRTFEPASNSIKGRHVRFKLDEPRPLQPQHH